MDSAFDLFTSLNCSKYYEEQIVSNLREIHSEWLVKKIHLTPTRQLNNIYIYIYMFLGKLPMKKK